MAYNSKGTMSVEAPKAKKAERGGARKPGARLGKFHLVERLGRGGMAEVWRAHSMGPKGFRRTAVVKRILPHLAEDPQFVEMFLAEARLSARLEHPNIVAVHELGEDHGDYFIAMEYVRGRDLVTVLRAHDPSRPGGMPETFCPDNVRCRFMGAPGLTSRDVIALLSRVADQGVEVVKTEYLRNFDGIAGYTLSQGQ